MFQNPVFRTSARHSYRTSLLTRIAELPSITEEHSQQSIWSCSTPCGFALDNQEHFHLAFLKSPLHTHNSKSEALNHNTPKQTNSTDDLQPTGPTLFWSAHATTLQNPTIAHRSNGSLRSLDVVPASNRPACLSLARNDAVVLGHIHDHIGPVSYHQFCQDGESAEQIGTWDAVVRKDIQTK
jgi:hypothetical protein